MCTCDPFLHLAIIRGAIQKGRLFSWIVCQFSPFRWSNFDLELIYFDLSMNTPSYSPIALGTYNRWKVEFVLKTKMTKTSIQRRLWRNVIQRGLVVPIFIQSRSLLFEGNASLQCICVLVPFISRQCLDATGSSMLTFMVLADRSIMP